MSEYPTTVARRPLSRVLNILHRNVQRFRGGLVFKAHRLCAYPTTVARRPLRGGWGLNEKRFRGGLVFKAHRLLYHSKLGLRVIKRESTRQCPAGRRTRGPRTRLLKSRARFLRSLFTLTNTHRQGSFPAKVDGLVPQIRCVNLTKVRYQAVPCGENDARPPEASAEEQSEIATWFKV